MGLFFEEVEVPPLLGPFPLAATSGLSAYKSDLFGANKPLFQRTIGADQFTLFQLLGNEEGPVLADLHNVEPKQKGSSELPDIRVGIELVSLNVSSSVSAESNTRATLRIDVGEDFTANNISDLLFWAMATGIDLYKAQDIQKTKAQEFRTRLSQSFRRQPIDLADSIGTMRIAVVAHEEPSWWQRVFKFAADNRLSGVLSTIGFPAITGSALKLVDSFFDLLDEANPRTLVHSQPITIAFSQRARDYFEMGLNSIKVAVLNPGWFLMIRYADVAEVAEYEPIYFGGYGVLVPRSFILQKGKISADPLRENPLNEFTYAVLRVRSKAICINTVL